MPLALSGLINYSIGLYHTLMPEGSTSGAAGAMWKTLLDYEAKDNNRLMLVFFSQREQPGGYWEFHTSPERILFSSMANADRPMMMQFRGMNKGYLNELDLERWVRQSRLRNARAPFA